MAGATAPQRRRARPIRARVVTQSKIEEDPRLKKMWAGYAFAIDFREERGHAYMLDDQTFTGRQQKPQPGTCLNCHASMYVAFKQRGRWRPREGFEKSTTCLTRRRANSSNIPWPASTVTIPDHAAAHHPTRHL